MSEKPSEWNALREQRYRYGERWRIIGIFETISPLHIGSGETTEHPKLLNRRSKKPCEVQAVTLDCRGLPCIPGSAIKGVLRSWASAFVPTETCVIKRLFGD